MSSSAIVDLSVEELLALLKKTSLPTVVVEGSDDLIIYRRLEERLAHLGVSVLPTGGRDKVLSVFSRRDELPQSAIVVFVADMDLWVFTGMPPELSEHKNFIVTHGYSLENDAISDGRFINYLDDRERPKFLNELSQFIDWYSLAISRHLSDPSVPIKLHPNHILDSGKFQELVELHPDEEYPSELKAVVLNRYDSLIRGKSLLALLMRQISYPGRPVKHHHRSLLESVAVNPGDKITSIFVRVEDYVSALS